MLHIAAVCGLDVGWANGQDEKIDGLGFTVEGMVLDGAKIDKGMLAVTPEITNSLPTVQFMWTLKKEHAKGKQVALQLD